MKYTFDTQTRDGKFSIRIGLGDGSFSINQNTTIEFPMHGNIIPEAKTFPLIAQDLLDHTRLTVDERKTAESDLTKLVAWLENSPKELYDEDEKLPDLLIQEEIDEEPLNDDEKLLISESNEK